jgi:transposase
MGRAYSLDLRERVVATVLSGQSCAKAAERHCVSTSSAIKWTRRKRQTGSAAAAAMGGKRPKLLESERDWLLARMAEKPDLTLAALLAEVHGRGPHVSLDTLWRFLKGLGLSFKKNHSRRRTGPSRHRKAALLVAQVPDPH